MSRRRASSSGVPKLSFRTSSPPSVSVSSNSERLRKVDSSTIFPPEKYVDQPEPAANDAAVLKEGVDLMRVSIRRDIKVFGDLSEEEVPDAAPDEIS